MSESEAEIPECLRELVVLFREEEIPFELKEGTLHSGGAGARTMYYFSFTPIEEGDIMLIMVAFDLSVPDSAEREMLKLVNGINQGMSIGHFEFRKGPKFEGIMLRYGLCLSDSDDAQRLHAFAQGGIEACDLYYAEFAAVAGGRGADQVISDFEALSVTQGNA